MEFLFGFGGLFFPFGFLLLGAIVLAAIAMFGRRAGPDPSGRRPLAIYLLSVMFITLFTTAGAVAQIGGALAEEIGGRQPPLLEIVDGQGPVAIPPLPPNVVPPEFLTAPPDRTLSHVLRAGLIGLLGLTMFEFHRRQWRVLLRKESSDG